MQKNPETLHERKGNMSALCALRSQAARSRRMGKRLLHYARLWKRKNEHGMIWTPKLGAARGVRRGEPEKGETGCISMLFPRDQELSGQGSGAGRELWVRPSPPGPATVMGRCFKGRLCSSQRRRIEVISTAWPAFPSPSPRPLRPVMRPGAPGRPRPLQ